MLPGSSCRARAKLGLLASSLRFFRLLRVLSGRRPRCPSIFNCLHHDGRRRTLVRMAGTALSTTNFLGRCWHRMSVLLGFCERSHSNIVLLQPTRDGVRVAPFVFLFTVRLGNFHGAHLFFDILLSKPIFVLIEHLRSECLAHLPWPLLSE